MTRSLKKYIALLAAVILPLLLSISVCAEALPDGSVKLLPERLVVLDDSGRSVSDNGEYYFIVEGMEQLKTYTKHIQIMNLREDSAYHITMQAQPLYSLGDFDMEQECICEIIMGTKTIYTGKITGDGTPDMRNEPLDLGSFAPGDSRTMIVNITWRGTDAGGRIDNGHVLVYPGGQETLRDSSGISKLYGETEFKWIFHAEVADIFDSDTEAASSDSDSDKQNISGPAQKPGGTPASSSKPVMSNITSVVKTGGIIAIGLIAAIMIATLVLMIMLVKKKKRR